MQSNRYVDYYLACGEEDRQNVLEAKLLQEDSIYVIGCPRFDFYAEPYLSRLMEDRATLLGRFGVRSPTGPVILWVTNTTLGHGVQRARVMGHVRYGGWSKRELEDEIADHETQYREQSAAILELARRHPNWTFLVKVHPSEPIEPYQSLPAAVSNIYCEKNVPIRCALYHADVVVQRGCTTASESWMLGKPVVELDLGRYRQAIRADFRAGNESAQDVEQLDRIVQRYLAGAPIPPDQQRARERFIRDVYMDVSGKAAERCADAIDAIVRRQGLNDAARRQRCDRIAEENESLKRRSDNRVINRLKDLFGLDRDRSLRLWRGYVRASWQKPKPNLEIDATELYRRFGEALRGRGPEAAAEWKVSRRETS
jgi:surface carbohydrate biosynthesis protein